MRHAPMFPVGGVVHMPLEEVQIESFDGFNDKGEEIYTVVSARMKEINGHPVNRFKAAVIPTLTITGVAS